MKKGRPGQDGVPAVPAKRRSLVLRRLMFSDLPRWKCWCYRAGLGIPLFLVLALAVLTQTVLLKRLVLPPLEAGLGVRIEAGWVYVGRDGDLVMRDVKVRNPDIPGPAGTLVQVGALRATVDWWSVLSGTPKLSEVRLIDPLVRLSQSVDDATVNLASLMPKPSPGKGGAVTIGAPSALPRIVGTRIALELGEHHPEGTYTILKRLNLEGSLVPTGGPAANQYDIRLHETTPRRNRPGITLSGLIDRAGMEVELTGLALDDWPPAVVPTRVREQFRERDLKGDVVSTKFIARDGKWSSVRLELADIAVNLPLPEEGGDRPGDHKRLMRMNSVSGDITFTPAGVDANLNGRIEDLPYTVTLRFDGLSADAPFHMDIVSENFQIARNPNLLPYAPDLVRQRFRSFSSPTGEVDTRMTVTRGPPTADGPAPIQIAGLVNFSHVDAAYDRFPYRFPDLSGVVRFDDQGVDLVQIKGNAPSGAKLLASGRIAPLGTDAGVTLDIDVTDMPLDEGIQQALGAERGELIPAIFNRARYQELVDAGLVLPPARAAALRQELERLEARAGDPSRITELRRLLLAPVFALGGTGRVHVNLTRPIGEDSDWFTTIDVNIPEAGLLVDDFPLPILARDVSLHIDDDRADLTAGTFRALSGGTADISLAAMLHDPKSGMKDFRPDVRVLARDVPVDALFLHALPKGADGPDGRGLVQSMLRGLGIVGIVDASAHIAHRPDGPLGFDVHVDLGRTEMNPPPGDPEAPLRVAGLAGAADVSEQRLDLQLDGSLRSPGVAPGESDRSSGRMAVRAQVAYSGDRENRRWSYDSSINGVGLDASVRVEDLVRAFSESTADAMAAKRKELRPAGTLDADTRVEGSSETPVQARITVSGAKRVELDLLGARAALGDIEGTTVFRMGSSDPVTAEFRGFRSDLAFDGDNAGSLSLDGVYDFTGGPATDLHATIDGGRFESALTRRIVPDRLGAAAAAWWAAAAPRGQYDQRLHLLSGPDGKVLTTGELLPHSFAFTAIEPAGTPLLFGPPLEVEFPTVQGVIRFSPEGGEAVGLAGQSLGWSVAGEGRWTAFGPGEFSAAGTAELRSESLMPDLRAILPQGLRDAMGALDVRVEGPLSLEGGRFSIARRRPPAGSAVGAVGGDIEQTADYTGTVRFEDASLQAGMKVSGLDGSLDFEAVQPPGGGALQYGLKVRGDRATAAGVRMTDARARILSGDDEGAVMVPLISARCHGGRVTGQGHSWMDASPGADGSARRDFEVSAQWSGLRFAPVLADLSASMANDPATIKPPPPEDDVSRGILEGEISLAGTADDPSSRRGRGTLRVSGGRVVKFPLVMQLIEVSNLAPPVNAALDFARAALVVDGSQVVFEDFSIFSSAVSILGYGTMSWPGMDLDLRFSSKAAKPIPIISQLLEGLRNELIGTRVKGTVSHPVVSLEQFPETRRLIDRAIGQSPTVQEQQMEEIQRRARRTDTLPAPRDAAPVRPTGPDGPP